MSKILITIIMVRVNILIINYLVYKRSDSAMEFYREKNLVPKIEPIKLLRSKLSNSSIELKNINQLLDFFDNYKQTLRKTNNSECQKVSLIIDALFRVKGSNRSDSIADIIIPHQMNILIHEKWFKNNDTLFHKSLRPKTLTITNRWTFETTGINPFRALRPRQNKDSNMLKYTLNVINQTKSGCNFCNRNYTAMDYFGRIELPKSKMFSARNYFPYIDNVGLFIPGAIHNWMEVVLKITNIFLQCLSISLYIVYIYLGNNSF